MRFEYFSTVYTKITPSSSACNSLLKLFYKLLGKTMIMIGKYFIMLSPHDLIVYVSSLLITMDNKHLGLCSCDIHQYVTGTVQSLNV